MAWQTARQASFNPAGAAMKSIRRWLAALLVSMLWAAAAAAQPFPNRPVRLIVPYPGGGRTDILARMGGKGLGQRFVMENKAGASGAIGSLEVARAAPDGYTLLMATASSHGINSAVYAQLP